MDTAETTREIGLMMTWIIVIAVPIALALWWLGRRDEDE